MTSRADPELASEPTRLLYESCYQQLYQHTTIVVRTCQNLIRYSFFKYIGDKKKITSIKQWSQHGKNLLNNNNRKWNYQSFLDGMSRVRIHPSGHCSEGRCGQLSCRIPYSRESGSTQNRTQLNIRVFQGSRLSQKVIF